MTISELIEKLQKFQETYGDINVNVGTLRDGVVDYDSIGHLAVLRDVGKKTGGKLVIFDKWSDE
ncbi:hypothetical protein LWE69_11695 [Paenibacillus sp. UKAQ_18]|nr:hypothetical protein [Paenibacillus sp. UKAQ_18]